MSSHARPKGLLREGPKILSENTRKTQKTRTSSHKKKGIPLRKGQKVFSHKTKEFSSREAKRTQKTGKDKKVLSQKTIRFSLRRSASLLSVRQKIISQLTKFYLEKTGNAFERWSENPLTEDQEVYLESSKRSSNRKPEVDVTVGQKVLSKFGIGRSGHRFIHSCSSNFITV